MFVNRKELAYSDHNHDDRYYTESEVNNLLTTNSGLKITTGKYIGDDSRDRTINLGFTPQLVIISVGGFFGSNFDNFGNNRDQSPGAVIISQGYPAEFSDFIETISIITNGFNLKLNDTNTNALKLNCWNVPYNYVTFS